MSESWWKSSGVYAIESPSGGQYIGSTVNFRSRWIEHLRILRLGQHHSPALQAAFNKYGETNMVFRPLLICDKAMKLFYEQRCLDALRPRYNAAKDARAPTLGTKFKRETCEKIAAALTGKKQRQATIDRRVASREGYRHTEKTKLKIGAGNKGIKRTEAQVEANRRAPKASGPAHPMWGRTISDEHKTTLSKTHKGKGIPQSVRDQTSATMRDRGVHVGAKNPMAKAVRRDVDGLEFGTMSQAVVWCRANGWPKAYADQISEVLRGSRAEAYGSTWSRL